MGGEAVLIGGDNLPSTVGVGLTDLPNIRRPVAPPPSSSITEPSSAYYKLEMIIKFILEIYILKALLKHNPCIFWIQKTPSLHFCNLSLVKWTWELQITDHHNQVYPVIQQFHYKIRILDFYQHNTNLCVLDTLIVFRNTSNPSLKFDKFSQFWLKHYPNTTQSRNVL